MELIKNIHFYSIIMTEKEFHYNLVKLQDSLMRFALKLISDKVDAKDLVQETMLKALVFMDKFKYDSNFKAWVFTIMKNTFINNYRSHTRENLYRHSNNDSFTINNVRNFDNVEIESVFEVRELNENIEKLNDIYRIPIKMRIAGYKYKEIAEDLKLNTGTVKSRIFLSRKKLIGILSN
jgi:RNA polymerase sigma-70 factor (ECF subfamily)